MIISILIACIIAKLKHLKLRPALQCIWLFPVVIVEIVYLIFQIAAFNGYFGFIPYAQVLKSASLYIFLLPILRYGLYRPALFGSGLILVGTYLNKLVMAANNGLMPVYPTVSKWTGYFDASPLGVTDKIHCLGNEQTHLKILTDFLDIGYSILSVGDLLVHSFSILILYYVIKHLNQYSVN